jgi:hypothetical protein
MKHVKQAGETPARAPQVTITQGFASSVLQPRRSEEVNLPFLQEEARTCDAQAEPARCAMLSALFQHGAVRAGAFAPEALTIYD